jgi:D-2-hydroxyacid dehydrogenase (NADP+)
VTGLLVSHKINARYGAELTARAQRDGIDLELLVLPAEPEARIDDALAARAQAAYFSGDLFPAHSKQFFSATRKAQDLKWLHVFNAGVDHPVFATILERGVRLTTSSGSTAEPIAQTAIAALLYLARNFPRWAAGQRDHKWDQMMPADFPRDLRGQVVVIYGAGKIGSEIGRLARLLGLHVIGVRRSGAAAEGFDEMRTPAAVQDLLPKCDWLVIACPLSEQTRGLVDAALLAKLPPTARLINIARGEIVDEAALVSALRSGKLAGAYLDVFAQEPLPADSPLWSMPNVLVTPHNSAASKGNEARVNAIFLDNLRRWHRNEPLINEVGSI